MSDLRCYGITTVQLTVGVSTPAGVLPTAGVIDQVITGMTGAGLLYACGFSGNGGSMVAAGALITTSALPLGFGTAPVHFTSTGAAIVLSILKKLSSGYSGQQTGTP
jgi:hypothetical protein